MVVGVSDMGVWEVAMIIGASSDTFEEHVGSKLDFAKGQLLGGRSEVPS